MPTILLHNTHISDGVYCQVELIGNIAPEPVLIVSTELSRPITITMKTYQALADHLTRAHMILEDETHAPENPTVDTSGR